MSADILASNCSLILRTAQNIICSSDKQYFKTYLFVVFRLAMLLPPYLIFADLLDASPDLQSIRRVVHFVNSYLVSNGKYFNTYLDVNFPVYRVTYSLLDKSRKTKAPSSFLIYLGKIEETREVPACSRRFKKCSLCFRGHTWATMAVYPLMSPSTFSRCLLWLFLNN